ncbi:hypothetical protein BsWGS_23769 [Bradybaena similaris]
MLKTALIIALVIHSVVGGCGEGWAEYGQWCISVSPEPLDWFRAAGACSLWGAKLVQIEDQGKQNFVVSQLRARGINDAWAGGSRRYSTSTWLWIPSLKTIRGYTNWFNGEPNDSKSESGYGEQCLHLMLDKWNDRFCSKEMHFVCEKKA